MSADPSHAAAPPAPDYFHLGVDYAGVLMMLCVSLVAWLGFHLKGADLVLAGTWGLVVGSGGAVAASVFGIDPRVTDLIARGGANLLSLKFSRDDETEADLVGLEIAARGGYRPEASVELWKKMLAANGSGGSPWLSTHPSGGNRIHELEANLPKVQHLYEQARQDR